MGIRDLLNLPKKENAPSQQRKRLKQNIGEFEHSDKRVKSLAYPTKILVAWGESISGNKEIRDWLMKNGYPELGMFCFALRNEDSAQKWLLSRGYPHLLALIKAIEGEKDALIWLRESGEELLLIMASAANGDENAKRLLLQKDRVFAALAMKIERVKDDIEWDNNSIYGINP